MAKDIETYLRELQAAMASAGADPALVQDALFDAEEYLQAEMAAGGAVGRGTATYEAKFAGVVEGYGSPQEVASAYLGTPAMAAATGGEAPVAEAPPVAEVLPVAGMAAEAASVAATGAMAEPPTEVTAVREAPAVTEPPILAEPAAGAEVPSAPVGPGWAGAPLVPPYAPPPQYGPTPPYGPGPQYGQGPQYGPQHGPVPAGVRAGMEAAYGERRPSAWEQVFGVFADSAVWKALVYMIISLATGIVYFTIVVTGISTAGGMLILIVGIPLLMAVLGIVRAMALFEGRLVEILLGTRMPRRPRATPPGMGFFQRMAFWLKDGRTWASMVYMVLMLPLGIAYFTVAVTGLSVGGWLVASVVWGWFRWTDYHTIVFNGVVYHWWHPWMIPIAVALGVLVLVGMFHLIKWIGRGHAQFAKAMLVRLAK